MTRKTALLSSLLLLACNGAIGTIDPPPAPAGRSSSFAAAGLWDQGFQQAVARSELGDISTVTIGSCLYSGACPAGVSCSPCPSGPATYSQSNFYSTVSSPPATYWVIDHNNDTGALGLSFNNCNSGPPDQSLPVWTGLDGPEVFNLELGQGTAGRRASLRLRNQYNPCSNGIPYLAIGTNKHRGNAGQDVGYFLRSHSGTTGFDQDHSRVSFTAALTQCASAPCLFYFNIHARYNGKPRLLVLTLGHINHEGSHLKHAHWNWPVTQSYFYSGYDIVYLRCEESGVPCLQVGAAPASYSFAMSRLLATASALFDDPINVGTLVSIEGVSWALETAGPSADASGWVEGMRVEPTTPTTAPAVRFSSSYDGESTNATLSSSETLHGKVSHLGQANAESCLEVVGRPATQVNGDGWCNDLGHWTTMTPSAAPNGWSYTGGVWRLAVSPVSSLFPPGTYRGLWRNTTTAQQGAAHFTVQQGSSSGTRSPIGWLDSVAGGTAAGWACDPDSPAASINVHLYVGGPAGSGAAVYDVVASKSNEGAVTAACGGGTAHRFAFAIPSWKTMAGQSVYAYGIDVTSNPHALLSGAPKTLPSSGPGPGSGGGTCSGHCGSRSADSSCWCDAVCSTYGDCCTDKGQYCP